MLRRNDILEPVAPPFTAIHTQGGHFAAAVTRNSDGRVSPCDLQERFSRLGIMESFVRRRIRMRTFVLVVVTEDLLTRVRIEEELQ